MTTNYSELKAAGLLSGTIKDANAKRYQRLALACGDAPRAEFVAIPLGDVDRSTVDSLARAERPRVQRWIGAQGRRSRLSPTAWGVTEINCGRYSSRCTYPKINYKPWVASYGYATATRLIATIWAARYNHRAPRGWIFGRDDLGIYIVRVNETRESFRYHLTSDDVRGGVAAIRAAGICHETVQREAKRAALAARRLSASDAIVLQQVGVFVSMADSLKAGNCASGTIEWGNQHGLDSTRRYPVRVIERLAKTHPSVSRVIDAARRRTLDDIERGYCRV